MRKILAILFVSLIILSGCSFFKKNPQKAVSEGIFSFSEVEKLTSDLTLSGVIKSPPGEKPEQVKFSLGLRGGSDYSDEASPKINTAFEFSAEADGKALGGQAEIRILDKKVYLNITKIDLPDANTGTSTDTLAPLKNTWWAIPFGESNPFEKWSDKQKKIQETLKTSPVFTNSKEDGEDVVEGEESVRYRVDLNRDAAKQLFVEILKLAESPLSPEQELDLVNTMKDLEFSGAVWVGDDDEILHRVKGTIASHPEDGPVTSVDFDYKAGNYGKKVEVSAPEGAQEFNPLMLLSLMGGLIDTKEGTSSPTQAPVVNPKP